MKREDSLTDFVRCMFPAVIAGKEREMISIRYNRCDKLLHIRKSEFW